MIASITCSCGHPGPTVHVIGAEARDAAIYAARLAAVRSGWAVAVERVSVGPIAGVCPRCRAHRTAATIHMESR